jgi:hypothetical protein
MPRTPLFLILGGINRQKHGLNAFKARRWVVVHRGFHLVEVVMGIRGTAPPAKQATPKKPRKAA